MRKNIIHRLAMCRKGEVTLLSEYDYDWWAGTESPPPHISHLDLHDPEISIGIYLQGPIYKNFRRGRAFIELSTDRAWTLTDSKRGLIFLDREFETKALHPGILDPIMRKVSHQLEETL